jgi:hypothetical protein
VCEVRKTGRLKLKYIELFTYQHQGEGGKHTMDIKETKQEKRIKTKGAVE